MHSGSGTELRRRLNRPVRRAIAAAAAVALAVPATAAAETTIAFRQNTIAHDYVETGFCGFAVHWQGTKEHWLKFQYEDIPEGTPRPRWGPYQVTGWHFVTLRETASANGRTVDIHGETNLVRRDMDRSNIYFDELGRSQGYATATDHISISYTARAADGGVVLKHTGRQVREHTSIFKDGVRVGRIDEPVFTRLNVRNELCAYLAG